MGVRKNQASISTSMTMAVCAIEDVEGAQDQGDAENLKAVWIRMITGSSRGHGLRLERKMSRTAKGTMKASRKLASWASTVAMGRTSRGK